MVRARKFFRAYDHGVDRFEDRLAVRRLMRRVVLDIDLAVVRLVVLERSRQDDAIVFVESTSSALR